VTATKIDGCSFSSEKPEQKYILALQLAVCDGNQGQRKRDLLDKMVCNVLHERHHRFFVVVRQTQRAVNDEDEVESSRT
jgi:hypothetical protein